MFIALSAINTDLYAAEAGMPQLDPTYWASQGFWLILIFTILYISISKFYLPKIKDNLDNRENKIKEDLENASKVMRSLFNNPIYLNHLKTRGMKQTIMLGFSDGTKDGGYFMANWSIYLAKESLSKLSNEYGVRVAFFDGRGGPPARGGGNTHEFYASMGDTIQSDDIQITIQGQTISSNFGTLDSSQFNLVNLLDCFLGLIPARNKASLA